MTSRLMMAILPKLRCKQTFDPSPLPEYWLQRTKYLAEPEKLFLSHLLCQHNGLRPHYFDIFLNERTPVEISAEDQVHIAENFSPLKSTKKPSSGMSSGKKETTFGPNAHSRDSFARHALLAGSTFLGDLATERVLSSCSADVDIKTLREASFAEVCRECLIHQRKLLVRRFRESELIGSLNEQIDQLQETLLAESPNLSAEALEEKLGPYFLIDLKWTEKWTTYISYAEDNIRAINRTLFDQFPTPGKMPKPVIPSGGNTQQSEEDEPEFVAAPIMQVLVELYGAEATPGYATKDLTSRSVPFTGKYVSSTSFSWMEHIKTLCRKSNPS